MKTLWEILVPTQMERDGQVKPIRTRYHKIWDQKVREISGGLTILRPAVGYWVSPDEELFVERMIPVRINCTEEEIEKIADMTAEYYNQRAVMFYAVSHKVVVKYYGKDKN